ncbi:hypothetical protein AFL01nite_02960 [Aeromicrobium flavum]|uniref:Uncharacterized protein n=1 Tax=Aeromicrobium flavum TaxID=416568 RepID=A0A512HR87_9ACTN|nr:hypothetical protein [Aeromicrobium flavum]GEO87969.1 hypothetical protein AFL01nite_02960 [Aeromicrobium flavum]
MELRGVEEAITRFSDRPDREASEVDLRDFLARWDGRFAEVPPNAVLSYAVEPDTAPVQVVVEISRPRFDEATSTIVFAAERVGLTPDRLEGADHPVEEHAEIVVPARTGPVSVLIDSEGPQVEKGQIATLDAATAPTARAIHDVKTLLPSVEVPPGQAEAYDELNDRLESVTARSHVMSELNGALMELRAAASEATRNTGEVTLYPATRAVLSSYDIEVPQLAAVAELESTMDTIESKIDTVAGDQESEMVRTQALLSNFTRATDTASNSLKTASDSLARIARDL